MNNNNNNNNNQNSLSSNTVGDCASFQNVVALEISPDGRLWVADSGTAGIFSRPIRGCKAKIVAYDLGEFQLILSAKPSIPSKMDKFEQV